MKLSDLEFKAADFAKIYGPGQGGPTQDLYIDFTVPGTEICAVLLAKEANRLLKERLQRFDKWGEE